MRISVILVKSATLFSVVKLVGTGYLVILGGQTLWRLWRTRDEVAGPESTTAPPQISKSARRAFVDGLLTNVLNPKVATFYLSFLPQFISPENPVFARSVLLTSIHQVIGALWLVCVVGFVSRMQGTLTWQSMKRKLEAATGAILVAFGVKLAVEQGR